jgi:hypothetical protein
MNERIQELAEQARKTLATDAMMGGDFNMNAYEQKFAELIVGECAHLFEIEYGTSEISGDEVARILKRYFGLQP